MINSNLKVRQLKAKIAQLQSEKELLRLFLHEVIEAYYRTINQESEAEENDE